MPGFHNRYTGMPGLNSYSMPGLANCDTGPKALCPVSRGLLTSGTVTQMSGPSHLTDVPRSQESPDLKSDTCATVLLSREDSTL